MTEAPRFAVVGHANKGKSSLVATLAEDDSVAISAQPRTTRDSRRFDLRADDETLLVFIDTPGFEQARHALDWMRRRASSAAERAEIVAAFVREHERDDRFPEERRLLEPILDGAGILYVVDGSRPFSPDYEAEMEVLRWTGRPRLAVINRIGAQDHTAAWRAALDQYFSLVREFNAQQADFDVRLELLRALRELHEPWRPFLDRASEAMLELRRDRLRRAARAIAGMLADQLTLTLEKRIGAEDDPIRHEAKLEERFRDRLRRRERRERDEVENVYRHRRLERAEEDLDVLAEDLFGEDVWLRLGLKPGQLAAAGALGGAAAGGAIDAAAGGSTFLLGALVGGAVGGVSGWLSRRSLARLKVQGVALGGKLLRIGPVRDPAFAWVALDRALLHHRLVSRRAHARSDALVLGSDAEAFPGCSSQQPRATRRSIEAVFADLRRARDDLDRSNALSRLAELIEPLLDAQSGRESDPGPAIR